jgi:hypothetical protein
MDDDLQIPVTYKNQELTFTAKFIQFGYSYRFEVDVNGILVFFEPDEERNFRAIVNPSVDNGKFDRELIELIMVCLREMIK